MKKDIAMNGKGESMKERSFDEMIAYFNRRVSEMDIARDYKIELLGMVTALGYKHEKSVPQWIPCSERLPEKYGEYRITWITSASGKRLIGDAEFEVTSVWDNEHDRFEGEWLLDDYIKNYPDVKVLAWKPLEEPWKGEKL